MKPRRKGYKRFMLESAGAVEASRRGDVIPVLDKNGIVRIRKRTRSVSAESHCVTVNHGLKAFLNNGRWRTKFSKLKAITNLLANRGTCQIDPKIAAQVKEFVNSLTVEDLKSELQSLIDSLEGQHKYAYAKRIKKDLDQVEKILKDAQQEISKL